MSSNPYFTATNYSNYVENNGYISFELKQTGTVSFKSNYNITLTLVGGGGGGGSSGGGGGGGGQAYPSGGGGGSAGFGQISFNAEAGYNYSYNVGTGGNGGTGGTASDTTQCSGSAGTDSTFITPVGAINATGGHGGQGYFDNTLVSGGVKGGLTYPVTITPLIDGIGGDGGNGFNNNDGSTLGDGTNGQNISLNSMTIYPSYSISVSGGGGGGDANSNDLSYSDTGGGGGTSGTGGIHGISVNGNGTVGETYGGGGGGAGQPGSLDSAGYINFWSYYYNNGGKGGDGTIYITFVPNEIKFIQVGTDVSGIFYNTKLSYNGIDWIDSSNNPFSNVGYGVAHGTNNTIPDLGIYRWVMVGIDSSNNTIKYTDDQGITWNNASSNPFTGFYGSGSGIKWGKTSSGNNLWVAVGGDSSNNTIKYSYDGSVWLNTSNPFYNGSNGTGSGNCVDYGEDTNGNPLWVAGGEDISNNTIKYSLDGIVWNNATNVFNQVCNGVSYGFTVNGNIWTATGRDSTGVTIKYSFNGITWFDSNDSFGLTGQDVDWGIDNSFNSIGICVGNDNSGNTIKYSYDGINWNNANNGFTGGSNSSGFTVIWGIDSSNNKISVTGGRDNSGNLTTKYSYNGIDWINTTNNTIFGTVIGIGSRDDIIIYKVPVNIQITRAFYQLQNGNIINEDGNSSTIISLENSYTTFNDTYAINSFPTFQRFDNESTSYVPTLQNDSNTITYVPYELSGSNVDFLWSGAPNYGISKFNFTMITLDEGSRYNYYTGEVTVYLVYLKVNGCDTGPGPYPPRLWTREDGNCPDLEDAKMPDGSQMTFEDLSEKRKATIFQYTKNSAGFSKKQNYSRLARGIGKQRGVSFATQSDTYSNPNIRGLKLDGIGILTCPSTRRNWALTNQNDTPGPLRRITNYPSVPLYNYIPRRTYLAGGTKWPQYGGNPRLPIVVPSPVPASSSIPASSPVPASSHDYGYSIFTITDNTSPISIDISGTLNWIPLQINIKDILSVKLGNKVTGIGAYAFMNATSLTSIEIPENVTNIGAYAFFNAINLTSCIIPNTVTSIHNYAFYNTTSLISIIIPDSVISIGSGVFQNALNIVSISFTHNSQLTSIGSYAFYNANNLNTIMIPFSVTTIGEEAFYGITRLSTITIPSNVTRIGPRAFYGTGLTTVTFNGTTIPNNMLSNNVFPPISQNITVYHKEELTNDDIDILKQIFKYVTSHDLFLFDNSPILNTNYTYLVQNGSSIESDRYSIISVIPHETDVIKFRVNYNNGSDSDPGNFQIGVVLVGQGETPVKPGNYIGQNGGNGGNGGASIYAEINGNDISNNVIELRCDKSNENVYMNISNIGVNWSCTHNLTKIGNITHNVVKESVVGGKGALTYQNTYSGENSNWIEPIHFIGSSVLLSGYGGGGGSGQSSTTDRIGGFGQNGQAGQGGLGGKYGGEQPSTPIEQMEYKYKNPYYHKSASPGGGGGGSSGQRVGPTGQNWNNPGDGGSGLIYFYIGYKKP